MKNRTLNAIIGLARAIEGNSHLITEETDRLLLEGLRSYADESEDFIDAVHQEKKRIVPDCFVCQSPCGRTSDPAEIFLTDGREEILSLLLSICAKPLSKDAMEAIYMGIYALGTDWSAAFNRSTIEILDRVGANK